MTLTLLRSSPQANLFLACQPSSVWLRMIRLKFQQLSICKSLQMNTTLSTKHFSAASVKTVRVLEIAAVGYGYGCHHTLESAEHQHGVGQLI